MAIVDPFAPLKAVCINTPNAGLHPEMDLDAYRKERDPAQIREADGAKPVYFVLKPLKPSYVASTLDDIDGAFARFSLAFRASCHSITLSDGTEIKPSKLQAIGGGVTLADAGWVDEVAKRCKLSAVYEMGGVAWQRARLSAEDEAPFV